MLKGIETKAVFTNKKVKKNKWKVFLKNSVLWHWTSLIHSVFHYAKHYCYLYFDISRYGGFNNILTESFAEGLEALKKGCPVYEGSFTGELDLFETKKENF